MYVSVSNKCKGCGACATICPEVFDLCGNFAVANQRNICGNEEYCIDALINCPFNAIMISDYA